MRLIIINRLVLIIISVIFLISCDSEDPVAPQEEHFETIGAVIYDATGAEALRILRGETNDTLYAEVNILSDHFDVKFINDDEEIVDPPTNEESSMAVDVSNTDILDIVQDEPGAFEFHLRGKSVGETGIEIKILHNGHSDYRSGLITVIVEN